MEKSDFVIVTSNFSEEIEIEKARIENVEQNMQHFAVISKNPSTEQIILKHPSSQSHINFDLNDLEKGNGGKLLKERICEPEDYLFDNNLLKVQHIFVLYCIIGLLLSANGILNTNQQLDAFFWCFETGTFFSFITFYVSCILRSFSKPSCNHLFGNGFLIFNLWLYRMDPDNFSVTLLFIHYFLPVIILILFVIKTFLN
jgi:hypothetical protein